jgi:hypothetical protein
VVDISGASITNADIGGARLGNLQVMNGASFDNAVSIRGGLSIAIRVCSLTVTLA